MRFAVINYRRYGLPVHVNDGSYDALFDGKISDEDHFRGVFAVGCRRKHIVGARVYRFDGNITPRSAGIEHAYVIAAVFASRFNARLFCRSVVDEVFGRRIDKHLLGVFRGGKHGRTGLPALLFAVIRYRVMFFRFARRLLRERS